MPSPDVPAALIASRDDEGIVPETALQVRKAIYSHDQLTASDMDLVFSIARTEAAWVIAHLTRGGELSSAEKRLLQFLGRSTLDCASFASIDR